MRALSGLYPFCILKTFLSYPQMSQIYADFKSIFWFICANLRNLWTKVFTENC
jgi:hypothetical protein